MSAVTKPQAGSDTLEKEMILRLERIDKFFGSHKAVDDVTLEMKEGEIFTLLGPSGCGKTTTLRQIAGLEQPDSGKIFFRGQLLVSPLEKINVPTHKRKMGMVFQSYAIWPHLTVFETVAYPLAARKVKSTEIHRRVMETLELVGLKGMENRPGPALSGGQQQRVALARALIYEPSILLLDEPFSNLDVKLREQMRVELKLLQRRVGVTVILVTHDQLEALSLSDRIAIMNQGKVEQVGTPKELYEKPRSAFVRDFVGKCITLNASIENIGAGSTQVVIPGAKGSSLIARHSVISEPNVNQQVTVSIRAEDIVVNAYDVPAELNDIEGVIDALLFVGDRFECHVIIGDEAILVYAPRNQKVSEGTKVRLHFPPDMLTVWPK